VSPQDYLKAPTAEKLPKREPGAENRDFLWHAATFAATPELHKWWADRYIAAGGKIEHLG
jgi:hypothetical protein